MPYNSKIGESLHSPPTLVYKIIWAEMHSIKSLLGIPTFWLEERNYFPLLVNRKSSTLGNGLDWSFLFLILAANIIVRRKGYAVRNSSGRKKLICLTNLFSNNLGKRFESQRDHQSPFCGGFFHLLMPNISIRLATAKDAELVADLSRQTFYETFASQNTTSDMEKFMNEQFSWRFKNLQGK